MLYQAIRPIPHSQEQIAKCSISFRQRGTITGRVIYYPGKIPQREVAFEAARPGGVAAAALEATLGTTGKLSLPSALTDCTAKK